MSAGSGPRFWHPAKALGKAVEDGPILAPATHVGDSDGVPYSWLQPGPVLVVAAMWGMN